ncbi:MAG TPA: M20/M25/M40 family metallo-hydrolase, partial [Aggregatilineales bacterium]|nr:M20/M25/M40 family metallo-hydrolase [Aggregatilineales bacterium]
LDNYFQTRREHPLLGHASLHASLIEGGTGLSTYPPKCTVQIERRSLPGETLETIRDEIVAILDDLHAADPQFRAEFEISLFQPGLETPLDDPLVMTLSQAMQQRLNNSDEPPTPAGVSFWMDSALLAQAGIPTVIFGPTGAGAHADVEWVELSSISACIDVLMATARAFCG